MTKFYYAGLALLFASLAGCASNKKAGEERFLSEREQKAALAKTQTPQYYGFNAYPLGDGIGFSGQARLHPNHIAHMEFDKPGIPVIKIEGHANRIKALTLIDTSSPTTWMDFSSASKFGATFLGMGEHVIPYRDQLDDKVKAYAAVVRRFRMDQLFIENIPVYVRMSEGALGPVARGVLDPTPTVSMGYDLISAFETVQINSKESSIIFSSSHVYRPDESLVMAKAPILSRQGYGLVVEGAIFGEKTPIVIDFAGDFHFMRSDSNEPITKQVSIGDVVYRKVPTTYFPLPNALPRMGRRMLDKYVITICPTQRAVYFEMAPPK